MCKSKIRNMSKKKKIILVVCLTVLAAGIIFFAKSCGGGNADDEFGVGESMTAAAERMDIAKTVSSDGEITTALQEKKTPHATYKLEKINVTEGQAVKEGGTILTYANGTRMVAPYDCAIVGWDLPDIKKTLTNDHYVEIAGTDVLKMELSVNEDDIFLIKKGDPAKIKVTSVDKKYKGEVSFISDIGDYSDGMSTFKVEVLFDNDGSLKLGMNGKATITLAKAKDVIAVPVDAVYDDGESSYVTVQRGENMDDTEEVEVTTGLANDEFVEIKSGLEEGDIVVYTPSEDEEWEDEVY